MNDKKDTTNQTQTLTPQEEMMYRLKTSIDKNGRYKYALDDLSLGFAAGGRVPQADARKQIEDYFAKRVGQSPWDYLQGRFDQNRERSAARGRGR